MSRRNFKQNYLSPVEFTFVIDRLPHVTFFTQTASLPGVSSSPVEMGSPFKKIYFSPDNLMYDEFSITFRVNENMDNYMEIYNWMLGLTFPDKFEQYEDLKNNELGLYSDASIIIMSNSRNPNIRYKLNNIFPIALGNIELDTTSQDVNYVSATATFRLDSFEIDTIG